MEAGSLIDARLLCIGNLLLESMVRGAGRCVHGRPTHNLAQHRPPPPKAEAPERQEKCSSGAHMVCIHKRGPKESCVLVPYKIEVLTVIRRVDIH